MSSTTLLVAVTGGVFCGASLIGTFMMLILWLQAGQKKPRQMPPLATTHDPEPRTVRQPLPPEPLPMNAPLGAPPKPTVDGRSQYWLDGVGGMIAGQRIMLDGPQVLMGRSGVCDIQLHDPKISRQHAILRLLEGQYQLEDMRSLSGTWVNGRRITTYRLRDRDQVRMGDSLFVFRQQ